MDYSKTGLELTERFESCRLTAYQDQGGIWTIGWGHTLDVHAGDTCSQEQADAWLVEDTQAAANDVNELVKVSLTQGEFDALVDFVYNLGGGAFAGSTLLRRLNTGDYQGAAELFDEWDHIGGKVVAGLLRRRQDETKEFQGA